jgi:hypothetical protein
MINQVCTTSYFRCGLLVAVWNLSNSFSLYHYTIRQRHRDNPNTAMMDKQWVCYFKEYLAPFTSPLLSPFRLLLLDCLLHVMAPTSNAAATRRRRQSCDRCHGLKLRYIRTGNSDTGACNRCIRQSAQCAYSSSLPKGRPSMYRLAGLSTFNLNPSPITPVIPPKLGLRHLAGLHTVAANTDANTNTNTNPTTDADADANMNEDAIMAEPIDMSTFTWPWLASLNWNDMQADGSGQELSQGTSNSHSIGNPQNNTSATSLGTYPSILNWTSTGIDDGGGNAQGVIPAPVRLHERGHGLGSKLFGSGSSSNSSSTITDKSGPNAGIPRLSQLGTRLYPLHRSSCILAEIAASSGQSTDRNQARQSPFIDDAAFKSVSAWIYHLSADVNLLFRTDYQDPALDTTITGDTLHDAFSASHHLLEILRCLQGDAVNDILPSTSTTSTEGAQLDFWASITPPSMQSKSTSNENTRILSRAKFYRAMHAHHDTSTPLSAIWLSRVIHCSSISMSQCSSPCNTTRICGAPVSPLAAVWMLRHWPTSG